MSRGSRALLLATVWSTALCLTVLCSTVVAGQGAAREAAGDSGAMGAMGEGTPGALQPPEASADGVVTEGGAVWAPAGPRTVGERYGRTPKADPDAAAVTEGSTPTASGISVGEYFKVLGWLVAVVLFAVASIYGLKKLQAGTARLGGTGRLMEVVARTGLTSKHQLVMVRVAERILIVGVSPDGISRVTEFNDLKDVVQVSRGESFHEQLAAQEVDLASVEADEEAKNVDVAPYRREIRHLKDLIGSWKRGSSKGARP